MADLGLKEVAVKMAAMAEPGEMGGEVVRPALAMTRAMAETAETAEMAEMVLTAEPAATVGMAVMAET
jgi:hypothetical protein